MTRAAITLLLLASLLGACGQIEDPVDADDTSDGVDARLDDTSTATDTSNGTDTRLDDTSNGVDAPDAGQDTQTAATCPPTGPYGGAVGDIAPDLMFPDCDGNMHSLHDLCEADTSWVAFYAGWCPRCNSFAQGAEDFYQGYAAQGVQAFYIITENASYDPPSAAYCKEIRDRFGFTMPVLYDATGVLSDTFGVGPNDSHVVMTRGNVVYYKGKYQTSRLSGELDGALAQ